MNLAALNDQSLLQAMDKLVADERETLVAVLAHLREIERRRLFCDLGFSSLFDYAVKKLGYSGDQAMRRINAMRMLKDIPEATAKLQSGALSLTNASQAQSLFRRVSMRPEQKREFLRKIENKSTREAEREIAAISPQPIKKDSVRAVTDDLVAISFSAPRRLEEKLRRLRGLKGHRELSMADLIEQVCDLALAEWDPARAPKRIKRESLGAPMSQSAIRRAIWRRDHGKCVNCDSRHAVEIDHIVPRALGGSDSAENLRLLCRSCNQRAAIAKLGMKTMAPFLDRGEA